jgi:hypothetical protein
VLTRSWSDTQERAIPTDTVRASCQAANCPEDVVAASGATLSDSLTQVRVSVSLTERLYGHIDVGLAGDL